VDAVGGDGRVRRHHQDSADRCQELADLPCEAMTLGAWQVLVTEQDRSGATAHSGGDHLQ
jgi:hypothetical protein